MNIWKFTLAMLLGAALALIGIFVFHTITTQDRLVNDVNSIKTTLNLSTIE